MRDFEPGDIVGYSQAFLDAHKPWQADELSRERGEVLSLGGSPATDMIEVRWVFERPSRYYAVYGPAGFCHRENIRIIRPKH